MFVHKRFLKSKRGLKLYDTLKINFLSEIFTDVICERTPIKELYYARTFPEIFRGGI